MKLHRYSFLVLDSLFKKTPVMSLKNTDKYVVFSDLHLGNGKRADDFRRNADLVLFVLRRYFEAGYHLILNGDIEELQKFTLTDIVLAWPQIFHLFSRFAREDRLLKIVGNHDLSLYNENNYPFPIQDSIRFESEGRDIFIIHGHQALKHFRKESRLLTFILRYIAAPLRINNFSVSHSSSKRFATEKRVYQFASIRGVLSIIGHTHRPLFESMAKLDSLRFDIERLCRDYPDARGDEKTAIEKQILRLREELAQVIEHDEKAGKRQSLYDSSLVVPCIFNSGTTLGKRGITNLVIEDGEITLVHWFDRERVKRSMQKLAPNAENILDSSIYRVEMKRESLDYIFSRIALLGASALHPGKPIDIDNQEDLSSVV